MLRYEAEAALESSADTPMRTASSAATTCAAFRSASEYTATVRIPMARAVRMTRSAISPRLAIRILAISVIAGAFIPVVSIAVAFMAVSHPEDAVAGARRGRVRGGGEGQPQNPAGVHGIDDAVVP